jgi:hypothetical protein
LLTHILGALVGQDIDKSQALFVLLKLSGASCLVEPNKKSNKFIVNKKDRSINLSSLIAGNHMLFGYLEEAPLPKSL